jgi:hypothetical protein
MTDQIHPVVLHLPNQQPRQIGVISAASDREIAARLLARYPFLPLHHVHVGDRPVAGLLAARKPTAGRKQPKQTEGQRQWKERKQRQRSAEQWRQHWIDKDDAKKRQG